MTTSSGVEAFMHEYARRYVGRDADGVTDLCLHPFLAIRGGKPIHMADRAAVRGHFAAMMDSYQGGGVSTWSIVGIEVAELGPHAAFATVRWNAFNSAGEVIRDTQTTYHLLKDSDSWRLLSYTNHF